MKDLLKRIRYNNSGNTFVVVVVTVSFLLIISAALVSTVATVYYSKIYDFNSRDNFHYVEQAMDEVYATIGSDVAEQMKKAYNETLENLVVIDPVTSEYKTVDNDTANDLFKTKFMANIMNSDYFKKTVGGATTWGDLISNQISNDTVVLDDSKMMVDIYKKDGTGESVVITPSTTDIITRVVIRNVILRRTAQYKNGKAGGAYTQTISTDVSVERPAFKVNFADTNYLVNNLFDYCLIADSGVEVNEARGKVLSISGDIYAASDFYNKKYNGYNGETLATLNPSYNGQTHKFTFGKVSNYVYGTTNTLYNHNGRDLGDSVEDSAYNGYGLKSKYSGFYVNGSKVSVMASNFIVPGTISVMDAGTLDVYGISTAKAKTDIWADNVVLAGGNVGVRGSQALFNADMYVRDDLTMDAKNTQIKLVGNYYGYSNGNSDVNDTREFVPTTMTESNSKNIYKEKDGTDYIGRGHYNSSAIVVNGENANIDLTNTGNIYIAGRSYIELSKQVTSKSTKTDGTLDVDVETYQYDADIKDYRTGESLSIVNAQFAYKPPRGSSITEVKDTEGNVLKDAQGYDRYEAGLPVALQYYGFFDKYFKNYSGYVNKNIPVFKQEEVVHVKESDGSTVDRNKQYIYINFDYMAAEKTYDTAKFDEASTTADDLRESFIRDYYYILNFKDIDVSGLVDSLTKVMNYNGAVYTNVDIDVFPTIPPEDNEMLKDRYKKFYEALYQINADEDFDAGNIKIPSVNGSRGNIYSTGTLAKSLVSTDATYDFKFNVETRKDANTTAVLKKVSGGNEVYTNVELQDVINREKLAKDYYKQYNYRKWTLGELASGSGEAGFIDGLLDVDGDPINPYKGYGEAAITPINYYMNYDLITDTTNINPDNFDLGKYKVWVSPNDVEVQCKDASDKNEVMGIIITKGDVYFKDYGDYRTVNKFSGIVISGGKVYINGDLQEMSSSVLCKKIIDTCIDRKSDPTIGSKAQLVLKLFKAYEKSSDATIDSGDVVDINNIDYTKLVGYEHWMKNVE